jgi:hypothetical protein
VELAKIKRKLISAGVEVVRGRVRKFDLEALLKNSVYEKEYNLSHSRASVHRNLWPVVAGDSSAFIDSSFEITDDVKEFLESSIHGVSFGGQITTYEEDGDTYGKLKPEVAKKLKRTYELFTSGRPEQEYYEDFEAGLTSEINALVKKAAEKAGVTPLGVKVDIRREENHNLEYTAYKLTVTYRGEEVEISGPYYKANDRIGDAISSWDWAAWLGDEKSPVYSDTFVEAYNGTETAQWFREAGSLEGDEDVIIKKLVELLS